MISKWPSNREGSPQTCRRRKKKRFFLLNSRFVYSENSVDPFLFFFPLGRNFWHHHLKKFFLFLYNCPQLFYSGPSTQPNVKAKVEFSNLACSGTEHWPGWGREDEHMSWDVRCKPAPWFLCLLIRRFAECLLCACFVLRPHFLRDKMGNKTPALS